MEDISTIRGSNHLAVRSPREGIRAQGRNLPEEAKERTVLGLVLLCSTNPFSICRLRAILRCHRCPLRVDHHHLGRILVLLR